MCLVPFFDPRHLILGETVLKILMTYTRVGAAFLEKFLAPCGHPDSIGAAYGSNLCPVPCR